MMWSVEKRVFSLETPKKSYLRIFRGEEVHSTEVAFALLTLWPQVLITTLPRIFLISIAKFVDSRDREWNPSSAYAKDFANAERQKTEPITTKKIFMERIVENRNIQRSKDT